MYILNIRLFTSGPFRRSAVGLISAFILAMLFSLTAAAAQGSVSSKIDFGISIFNQSLKYDDMDLSTLKKLIEAEPKNLPLHAFLLSNHINKITTGTKSISESGDDIEKILSFVLLRYDPQISITYFDRAYLYMLIANLGYQNFNGRSYALMALCDMAALLQAEPLNAYYHLFYTVVYASLKDHDISEFKLYDPLEELKKSLSFEITDPQFHYIVGSTFQAISQNSPDIHQLAYAEFMQAIKLAPKNSMLKEKVFRNLIELLSEYDQRKSPKPFWLEETAYLHLIDKNQDSAAAHNNLGYLYVMSNVKLDLALEHCKKAVGIDSDNPVFLDSLGCAYYKNRDVKKAVETLKKAYNINPNSKDVNEHLAEIYLQQNNNEDAIKHLEFIVTTDPKNALAANNFGYVLCEAGTRLDEALKYCRTAVEAEPSNAVYLDSLAWAFFKNNKLTEATETIARAIKSDPNIGALYIHRGDMLFTADKVQQAIDDYARGMALDPAFPDVHTNFAYLNSIKIMSDKLSKLKKAVPEVSSVMAGKAFSYNVYPAYFGKLFEIMGFPPEEILPKIQKAAPEKKDKTSAEKPGNEEKSSPENKSVEIKLKDASVTGEINVRSDTYGIEILQTTKSIDLKPSEKLKIINDTAGVEIKGTIEIDAIK